MRNAIIILCIILTLLTFSCKKDPDTTDQGIEPTLYNPRVPVMRSPDIRIPRQDSPDALAGITDLYYWNFDRDGLLNLDGQWEFYPETMLYPIDFESMDRDYEPQFIEVPSAWSKANPDLPRYGTATYRLILVNCKKGYYGLKIKNINTASTIFVNGTCVLTDGYVSPNDEYYFPRSLPQLTLFNIESNTVEIIIQVSNYRSMHSGIVESIKFGPARAVIETRIFSTTLDLILAGIFFVLGMYYLLVFILRHRYRFDPVIFLSFGCFCLIGRILMTGEKLLLYFIPAFPWGMAEILSPVLLILFMFFFILYFYAVHTRIMSKLITFSFVVALGTIVFLLVLPVRSAVYYGQLSCYVISFLITLYCIIGLIRQIFQRSEFTPIQLIGLFVLSATLANDFFTTMKVYTFGYLFPYGVIIYIATASLASSLQYSMIVNREKILTRKSRKDQLSALLSKINAHFFFNVLNIVSGLIQDNANKAEKVLESFAEIIKYHLFFELTQLITLREELNTIESYIYLENVILNDRLNWQITCNESLKDTGIPRLILQPLIENSIKYNIAPYRGGGTITIEITQDSDSTLSIIIKDTRQDNVEESDTAHKPTAGSGIALKNIRERLSIIYQDRAELTIAKEENGSTTKLTLPFKPTTGKIPG